MRGYGENGGILVLGGIPGNNEARPFTDAAAAILKKAMVSVGIDTNKCRYEYVVNERVSEFQLYRDSKKYTMSALFIKWIDNLEARLAEIKPTTIIVCGEIALRALTQYRSINHVQCYVLDNKWAPVIPIQSPDYYMPQQFPHEKHWMTLGLKKAATIAKYGYKPAKHSFKPEPSVKEAVDYLDSIEDICCVDIESIIETKDITCISFAKSHDDAICIPFKVGTTSYFKKADEMLLWKAIQRVMANESIIKIFQNHGFDVPMLRYWGIETKGPIHDTLWQANLINPELPKSLSALARIYCFCEPWKGTQDWHASQNPRELWIYNCRDTARTFEIYNAQLDELRERNLLDFCNNLYNKIMPLAVEMGLQGLIVDQPKLEELDTRLRAEMDPIIESLIEDAAPYLEKKLVRNRYRNKVLDTPTGEIMEKGDFDARDDKFRKLHLWDKKTGQVIKKAFRVEETYEERDFNPNSAPQRLQVLQNMGVKVPINRSTGRPTTNKTALLKIRQKYPLPFVDNLLRYSVVSTLVKGFGKDALTEKLDDDGRLRFVFSVTETGRFKCAGTPWDTGRNVQNFPRNKEYNVKEVIVPKPGAQLVQVDLSQVEARLVAYLSGDPQLLNIFKEGIDFHAYTQNEVAKATGLEVTRQLGKRLNHSCLTGDQEVLTPAGWLPIDQWDGQAIMISDGFNHWLEKPIKYHKYQDAEVFEVSALDFKTKVTENHRIPLYDFENIIDVTPARLLAGFDTSGMGIIRYSGIDTSFLDASNIAVRQLANAPVYCFTTTTGYFVARGTDPYVTGNSNYGAGAQMFSDMCLLDDGIDVPVDVATKLIDARMKLFPGVLEWQEDIRHAIDKTRLLVTPYGRQRYFFGQPDHKMYREAYAYVPQSTGVDYLNFCWIALDKLIRSSQIDMRVIQQCHDSLLLEVVKNERNKGIELIRKAFGNQRININGNVVTIPFDIEEGDNWGNMREIND